MSRIALYFFLFTAYHLNACQCPVTSLSVEECNKYEIIFRGSVDSVIACDNKSGQAIFRISELYKGNATKYFKVFFKCDEPCALQFNVGEEWIIYTRYKQINNAMMDWCSRSRKYFKIDKQDFYTTTYGNDYDDELKFLRSTLGLHRVVAETKNASEFRNRQPSGTETIVILISSIAAIIIFYWLFNKFFKS